MVVASGCGKQDVGVASGSGWNLWVWLVGVVVRRLFSGGGGGEFREKLERLLRNNIRGSKFRGAVPCSERGSRGCKYS